MSRLDPSILMRRMADLDQSFVRLGDAADFVITRFLSGIDFSRLTQAEIDAIAKSFGSPTGTVRRKQPSLVQPMQQQATSSSPLQQEQAMAQSDQQQLPKKGEFGGLCGHATCVCENARFEYIDERAEKRAFGKFYCEWCANDKNRQALTFRSDRDYSPACIERTVEPPKAESKIEKKTTGDEHYWDLA